MTPDQLREEAELLAVRMDEKAVQQSIALSLIRIGDLLERKT